MKIQHLIPFLFLAAFCTVSAQTNTPSRAKISTDGQLTRENSIIMHMAKIARTRNYQQLSQIEVEFIVKSSESVLLENQLSAAYALMFTDSPLGTNALRKLATSEYSSVAGTAEFSELRRQLAYMDDSQLLDYAVHHFDEITNSWKRTMLASWLGDRLTVRVVPLFLAKLRTDEYRKDENRLVRTELFFQVATHCDTNQLAEVSSMLNQTQVDKGIGFSEGNVTFLNDTSDSHWGRTNIPKFFERIIKTRLDGKGPI